MHKKRASVLVLIVLALLMLACNFPGYGTPEIDFDSPPAQDADTGDSEQTSPGDDNSSGDVSRDDTANTESADPTATFTPKPSPTVTPTSTPTETPTPTATPELGEPLTFLDPAWEWVEWKQIEGTGDLDGLIAARIEGGVAPYRSQLDDRDSVVGLEVPLRWRLCEPMPATLKVWSADGQYADTKVWIWEVGCP